MDHPMWGESALAQPHSNLQYQYSMIGHLSQLFSVLLSMAMIGASYLVRDERLVNLLYDMGGDECD